MAEEFLNRNFHISDEEGENVEDSPSSSINENIDITMEDEGESGSDIIIEEEKFAPRSSSPDIEIVQELKSATPFTVDLTKDDDDDETLESIGQSSAIPETSNTPVVDLGSEKNGSRQPSSLHSDNTGYTHSQSHHQSLTDYGYGSNTPKPNPQGISIKQEDDDTMSLIRDLNACANLPKKSWLWRFSSLEQPSDFPSAYDRHPGTYEKYPNGHSSAEMLTGSTSSVVISANNDRDKNPLLSGTAEVASSFPDTPLDMSVSNKVSLQKGTAAANSYSGLYSTMPIFEDVEMNINHVGSLLQKTDMVPTDFKSSMSSHPNSAFQAVTPSTSVNRVPDLVDYIVNPQSNTPSTSCNSGFSLGDMLFENPSQNSWFTEISGGINSQSWGSSVQSVSTQLSGSFSSQLPPGYSSINTDTALSSYTTSPSTSNGNYNQGTKSDQLHKFICGLPVLSPGTIIEQVGSNHNPSISNSLAFPSTSTSSSNNIPQKTIKLEVDVPQATAILRTDTAGPPSPEEPTFACSICLDSVKTIQSSSRNLCSTVCGHVFCSDCLQEALKKKKECPMCRRKLGKKQYHPLFL
ncbi:uncharacterized protein [Palaemon carinicauda]|uniref:uncharacterized protein isoform X2 n=1 Tax=Palaemon carinicauda TaxID=392227 RepID=UPI0035B657A7